MRPHSIPRPGFTRLACTSSNFCIGLNASTGAEVWRGRSWHEVDTPKPAHATTFGLTGVSCASSVSCLAVGEFTRDNHGEVSQNLAEKWNGTRWTLLSVPQEGQDNVLNAVSCVAPADCMAVGNDLDSRGDRHNVAAHWNGHSWRMLAMPGGNGFGNLGINGTTGPVSVSCPGRAQCMAVGSYLDANTGLGFNLAVAWNGHSWRLTRTAGPGGGLADVSCPSVGYCIATGQAGTLTLAERWNGRTWTRLRSLNP